MKKKIGKKWQRAIDDIVAVYASTLVRMQVAGRDTSHAQSPEQMRVFYETRIAQARKIKRAFPKCDGTHCACRHSALFIVEANEVARQTGAPPPVVYNQNMMALKHYLANLS